MENNVFFPPPPPSRPIRQIGVSYLFHNEETSNDPNAYTGDERRERQLALLAQRPNTGYAEGIRQEIARETQSPEP